MTTQLEQQQQKLWQGRARSGSESEQLRSAYPAGCAAAAPVALAEQQQGVGCGRELCDAAAAALRQRM